MKFKTLNLGNKFFTYKQQKQQHEKKREERK